MRLSVCPSCSRHVREDLCPFCGGRVEHAPRGAAQRVARIVLLSGAAALASACSAQAMYGAPAPDAGSDGATADSGMAPAYGAVVPDAGDP